MSRTKPDVTACTEFFNQIYDETFVELRRYVAMKCADTAYISDILQDVYLEYYKLLLHKGRTYAKNDRAVLFKIAQRKVYDYYSLKEKFRAFLPLLTKSEDEEECDGEEWVKDDTVWATFFTEIEAERIWRSLEAYPADVRKIFYLYFYEDYSHTQIAKALGYSVSAVKNKLYRTIREIREKERSK